MMVERGVQLAELIYLPRVVVYLGVAAILCTGRWPGSFLWITLSLVLPHFLHLVSIRYLRSLAGVRSTLIIDGLFVGALIATTGFGLLPGVVLVTCLVVCTLVIAPPAHLILNLLAMVVAMIFTTGVAPLPAAPSGAFEYPAADLVSATVLVCFMAVVARLCFTGTATLVRDHQDARELLISGQTRLRPYVARQVLHQVALGAEVPTVRRHLTVFFSDIQGFTQLMDQLSEDAITRLLNEYLDVMAQIACRHGGTVDKFMGDGVMVFFGDRGDTNIRADALACISMALDMRERLGSISERWQRRGSELHIRIGIHSGYCTVGNFGSSERMDYTAVGGTVNLASRLEGVAGTDEILISGATYRLTDRAIVCRQQPAVQVKGIAIPVQVFSVQGLCPGRGEASLKLLG